MIKLETDILKKVDRETILETERMIGNNPDAFFGDTDNCPLKHTFADGIYVREIFIPAGTFIVGKIHKHNHPNFLLSGTVEVATESGVERLQGPLSMISVAGTKRVVHAITDVVWITVHHNPVNFTDLKKLEDIIIADSYSDYDKFIESKKSIGKRVLLYLRKLCKTKTLKQ